MRDQSYRRSALRPPRTASPLVRDLFLLADAKGITGIQLGKMIGRHFTTITKWRHGTSTPGVMDIEVMIAVLGAKIEIKLL